MIADLLTIVIAALAGIAAFYIAGYFHRADQKRTLECLIEMPCTYCWKTYGVDLLTSVAQVTYDWTPLPGNTVAGLGLPRTTFLCTCPSCAMQTEYRDNAHVFVPLQSGLLDFTRQVRSLSISTILPNESAAAALRKSATPMHAGHKA